jgi:hypothetical protein
LATGTWNTSADPDVFRRLEGLGFENGGPKKVVKRLSVTSARTGNADFGADL